VRFISAAVPESALGHNGGDVDWVGCYNHNMGTCSSVGSYRGNYTYDHHALQIPNKIINGYFLCDEIVERYGHECDICDHVKPQEFPYVNVDFSPFQTYLANWGSSSAGVGANPVKVGDEVDKSKWVNRPIRGGRRHTGTYKHPDYGPRAGYGQDDLWAEWTSKDVVRVDRSDVNDEYADDTYCRSDGLYSTDGMVGAFGMRLEDYITGPEEGGDVVEMTAEQVEELEANGGGDGDDEPEWVDDPTCTPKEAINNEC